MGPSVAGISGGRTSAMMAFGLPPETILTFQNTGLEHPATLDFLCRLEDDLRREIVRLEWRPPQALGDAPKTFTFAEVRHRDLARRGEPFSEMLRYLNAYRRRNSGGPTLAPWARQRLCTAYLKIKPKHRYAESLFGVGEDYVDYVGIRADEDWRIPTSTSGFWRCVERRYPLASDGVTKADVMRFWSDKQYDLDLPEHLGNCTACFMKDERDLASALLDPATDADWWINIERAYAPMRRGRPSYADVLREAPDRMRLRRALDRGEEPRPIGVFADNPKRFKLVVRQERAPREPWSCNCAGAELLALEDEDDDDAA